MTIPDHLTFVRVTADAGIPDGNGFRAVQFMCADGKRRTFRMGRVPMSDAREAARHIESIQATAALGNPLDREQAEWLARLDPTLHARLVAVGLAAPRT